MVLIDSLDLNYNLRMPLFFSPSPSPSAAFDARGTNNQVSQIATENL